LIDDDKSNSPTNSNDEFSTTPKDPNGSGEHPQGEHPSRTLFVRNINSNVEDDELTKHFEQYGPIRSMYTQCKHRGFVMISYFDIRHAKNAMRHLQGKVLRRRKLDIHYSIPKDNPSEKDQNQGTLVVFNLDPSTTNEELKTIFGSFGEIKEIRETPNKKHHKFIEFYDVRDADQALKTLNKTDIKGKKIKIEPSRPGGARKTSGLYENGTPTDSSDMTSSWQGSPPTPNIGTPSSFSTPGSWGQSPSNPNPFSTSVGTKPGYQHSSNFGSSLFNMTSESNFGSSWQPPKLSTSLSTPTTNSWNPNPSSLLSTNPPNPLFSMNSFSPTSNVISSHGFVPSSSFEDKVEKKDNKSPNMTSPTTNSTTSTTPYSVPNLPNNKFNRRRSISGEDEKFRFALNISKVRNKEDTRTTLMIKNIPNKYSQKMLLTTVDETHKGTYDFFYLPIDFKNKCNVGYAFINFLDPQSIIAFYEEFNNKKWERFNSEKVCEIAYARIQGKNNLISHFQNSSLLSEDKKCRPIIFENGEQLSFPNGSRRNSIDEKQRNF